MKFLAAPKSLRTVVVLGAGASYGESAFSSCGPNRGIRPPIDANFLEWCQLHFPRSDEDIQGLLEIANSYFGTVTGVGLEELLTRIEASDSLHEIIATRAFGQGSYGNDQAAIAADMRREVAGIRDRRLTTIRRAIGKALNFSNPNPRGGPYGGDHAYLASALEADDTVISFNYDTLMDSAIWSTCPWLWAPELGMYGAKCEVVPEQWERVKTNIDPTCLGSEFRLLKVHGSIHFASDLQAETMHLTLSEGSYAKEPAIVPPLMDKRITSNTLVGSLWAQAVERIERAEAILIIGYSCPPTDFLASALLSFSSPQPRHLEALGIINPDEGHRRRLSGLVRSALGSGPTYYHERPYFSSLQEFVSGHSQWPEWVRTVSSDQQYQPSKAEGATP